MTVVDDAVALAARHAPTGTGVALALALLASCGKTEPAASSPREDDAASVVVPGTESETAATPLTPAKPVARVDLEVEFHRTRAGAGAGAGGYWILAELHNPHAELITDPRVEARLLDAEGELVGEAEVTLSRSLRGDARAAAAVYIAEPVEHEELELRGSGIPSARELPPLPLELDYEPPQRADLGGYFVLGQVTNTGGETVEGARLEILGLDGEGRLLGVDWLALDPIEAGETVQFDVGDLRYEEPPASFSLALRRPAER